MAFVGTLTFGFQLLASMVSPREHHAPASSDVSAHAASSLRSSTGDQLLAGRADRNGLTMRWFADEASLRAMWAGPELAG